MAIPILERKIVTRVQPKTFEAGIVDELKAFKEANKFEVHANSYQ